jgi:IS1 family transposase
MPTASLGSVHSLNFDSFSSQLLLQVAEVCREYQDNAIRNLTCKRVQADEIWAFCGAKEKNASPEKKDQGWGDVWTWTAIDADSKLIISWLVGNRDASCATRFMRDVASRIRNRIQLTTDGYKAYFDAVEDSFVGEIDYAMLIKIYGRHSADAARHVTVQQSASVSK